MKTINAKSILSAAALALVALAPAAANAEKIKKHTDSDGFEEWYWKGSVTVSRGSAHTFWIKGLTENTAITDFDVYCDFTYKEDGETVEDTVYAGDSCEVENSSGGWDKYVLLSADDWEWVPSSKSSLTFTVLVSGWGDDGYSSADMSFTFGHSDGESEYPGDVEPPEPASPKGTMDNPQTVIIKETRNPPAEAASTDCTISQDMGGIYYIKTPALAAGHKYFFGVDGGSGMTISQTLGGANLFENAECSKEYDGFASCSEAYSFVAPAAGVHWITVKTDAGFRFYGASMPALAPDKHDFADLALGTTSGEFEPGYLNDPASGAYDQVIDQRLFRVSGYKKGDNIVFRTDGATADLLMRLYDSKGNVLAESLRTGDGSQEVQLAWTASSAYSAGSAVYLGVCQQLEDGEEPSAGPVTVSAKSVSLHNDTTPLAAVPDGSNRSPADADGAEPSAERTLSADEWVNTFVVAARAGTTYRIKAACGEAGGLTLGAYVYTLSGAAKKAVSVSGSLDPGQAGWLEFSPTAHGNVYIDVSVAPGGYGSGTGLDYGPYVLYASAAGANLGILTVPMKGASQDLMGWKILSGPGIAANKEVFYEAGTGAVLPAGSYTLVAKEVKGFAKPDSKGFATVSVTAGIQPTVAREYKYADTFDPLDDYPDTKAKHPKLNKAYAPTKLSPAASKPAEATRSLWDDDSADWYTVAATAGCYYRFSFASKSGAPKMAVYGPDVWTKECQYVLFDDPETALQICAARKGTYYVKVSHLDEAGPEDSSYTLSATAANPGLVKFAKTAVNVKDSAGYVDLAVSRSSKDGLVRVKYRTVGSQTSKDDAYYYPASGVLSWAAGDNKAQTVRVRLVPNAGWAPDRTVKVVLEPFSTDDETFDAATEYPATFDTDKNGNVLDTATITIAASAKKAPGTIRVAGVANPKKPVLSVTAGETIEIPFERVLGADGTVGVKVETVKGTANKSGATDFTPATAQFEWGAGETEAKTLSVATKAVPGDWTAVKTFTLKLTAVTGPKYGKPTFAAATVSVNILNDKFADTVANYSKANAGALKAQGVAIKESKSGTWYVDGDGAFFTPDKSQKLTFTVSTPGTFTWTENGAVHSKTITSKDKTVTVSGGSVVSWRDAGSAYGTFTGLAATFDTANGVQSLAQVTFSATSAGKLSAKVAIGGKTYAFAGTGYTEISAGGDGAPATYMAELAQAGNRLYVTVPAAAETDEAAWAAPCDVEIHMAALPGAKGAGVQEDVWYFGTVARDNSKVASWASKAAFLAGYYTVSLVAPCAMPGEPQGSGYVTMTLDDKGKAKVAGMLADGTSFSASSLVASLGAIGEDETVRVPLYHCKGTSVFGGWLAIRFPSDGGAPVAAIDSPDTDIVWKNDDPNSTRGGEDGFALYLQPVGGWYDTVSNLQRSYLESDLAVDLPTGENALAEIMEALALSGEYSFAAQPSGQAVDLAGNAISVAKQTLVKDASKKSIDWEKSVNASNVKLTFKRATGIVSGTFDLWYEGTNAKGVSEQKSVTGFKHYGVLLLSRGDDGYIEDEVLSCGFFLAPQAIGKRKWTGSYRFDIRATPAEIVWTDPEVE